MKGDKQGGGDKKEGSKGKGNDDDEAQTVPEEVEICSAYVLFL